MTLSRSDRKKSVHVLVYLVAISICNLLTTPTIGSQYVFGTSTQTKERFILRLKASFTGHQHQTTSVVFSPNGRLLVTAGDRETTSKLWNTSTNQLIAELDGTIDLTAYRLYDPQPPSFFTSDGKILVTVRSHAANLWDAETGKLKLTLAGHERDICSVAFSPDGRRLATGGEDGKVKLWDSATGKLLTTLDVWRVKNLPRWRIVSRSLDVPITIYLSFNPDGRKMLTTLDWKASPAKLWDVESGRLIAALGGHRESWGIGAGSGSGPAEIHKALFSADGKFIVTESFNEARVWDADTGLLKQTFSSYKDRAKFSPDGRLIGPLKKGENIGLFNVETADLRIPLTEAQLFADQIVFSSDGHTAAFDGTIIDVSDRRVSSNVAFVYKRGRSILDFEDSITDIDVLSFHPSGRVLMAANKQFIRFWNVATGQLLAQRTEARIPAAFSPDGRLLVTTGNDKKTIQLWEVDFR
jgi:WD40 repeat protein